MKITHDNLWLCSDCMLFAETGDPSFLDYTYAAGKAPLVQAMIKHGLERLGPHLVPDFDTESGDGYHEFTWDKTCSCCKCNLGGAYYRYAILGEEPKP